MQTHNVRLRYNSGLIKGVGGFSEGVCGEGVGVQKGGQEFSEGSMGAVKRSQWQWTEYLFLNGSTGAKQYEV